MKLSNNYIKNLLVIGNGFDLHLGLHSTFKEFMKINDRSCKIINKVFSSQHIYNTHKKLAKQLKHKCPKYFEFVKFIFIFHNLQNKLTYKLRNIINKYHISIKHIPINNIYIPLNDKHSNEIVGKIPLTIYDISYNYFNIKLCCEGKKGSNLYYTYGLDCTLFTSPNNSSQKIALNKDLDDLNNWGNSKVQKLKKYICNIKSNDSFNDFWSLLILFTKYLDTYLLKNNDSHSVLVNNWYNDGSHLNNWYDIENLIKKYIISIYNLPKNFSSKNISYEFRLIHQYYTSDNYFSHFDVFSNECFDLFTYFNRYLDLNGKLMNDINNYISKSFKFYKKYLNYSKYNTFLFPSLVANNCKISNRYKYLYKEFSHLRRKILMHENVFSNWDINMDDILHVIPPMSFLLMNYFNYGPCYNDNYEHNYLFNFLREQLKLFEQRFGKYLIYHLKIYGLNHYKQKSKHLLDELSISSDTPLPLLEYSVLDFNYTPISEHIRDVDHIHGTLYNNNLIIGVGEQEISKIKSKIGNDNFYKQLYSFTKTYRLFLLKHKYNPRFLNHVKNIVFYGHSLGANDFPYFEALFDRIHLYSDHTTRLIFCYSGYGNKTDGQVKMELIPRIVHLLKQYSESLNKPHGDNFVARMFIDNRISLHLII